VCIWWSNFSQPIKYLVPHEIPSETHMCSSMPYSSRVYTAPSKISRFKNIKKRERRRNEGMKESNIRSRYPNLFVCLSLGIILSSFPVLPCGSCYFRFCSLEQLWLETQIKLRNHSLPYKFLRFSWLHMRLSTTDN